MSYPLNNRDPLDKSFVVYEYRNNNVPTRIGTVRAHNQYLADTKAKRLFHQRVWTKANELVE